MEYYVGKDKECIRNQPIRLSDTILPDPSPRESKAFAYAAMVGIGMMLGMFLITAIKSFHKPVKSDSKPCTECHNKFTSYFQNRGSKSPEEMAYGVLQTRNPRLLAAIAVIESDANPSVRNSGYKRRHDGAFQVNSRYHGRVPYDAVGQSLQAERILEELVSEKKNIKVALNSYGGDSTDRYSRKILAELVKVP